MKKIFFILGLLLVVRSDAQILKKITDKAKEKVDSKVDKKIDDAAQFARLEGLEAHARSAQMRQPAR